MRSMMQWMTSSPASPRSEAPRICLLSRSTRIFMKPLVSPFSYADRTRYLRTHHSDSSGIPAGAIPHAGAETRETEKGVSGRPGFSFLPMLLRLTPDNDRHVHFGSKGDVTVARRRVRSSVTDCAHQKEWP